MVLDPSWPASAWLFWKKHHCCAPALLQSKLGEDGEKLVHLPSDYLAQVEQLLMARRNEYSALQGWLGPRRFEALPINNLPDSHEDPKVAEGLHRIRQLDAKLAQAEASAIIAAREADPERWAEQEKARLARRAQAVETALKRERTKRMRSAQLVRAVAASQIMPGAMRASYAPSHTSGLSLFPQSSYQLRCFQLRPEDEALVEAVLQRDDDEAEQPTANPFLLDNSISLPVDHPSRPWTAHPSQWAGSVSLSLNGSHAAELTHVLQPPTFTTQPSTGEAGSSPDPPTEDGTASSQAQRLGQPGVTGEVEQPVHQTTPLVEAEVDLAVGLAAHTFALMRARQAAVAGLPLGVINARLDEFVHEHCWDADGSLADFSSVASSLPKPLLPSPGPHRLSSTSVLAGGVQESLVATSSGNKPVSAAAGSVGGQSGSPRGQSAAYTASGKRDYLREEREAKELAAREVDLDARIRAFKTSDPAGVRLSADQVASLVAECRHMAELAQQRKAAAAAAAMPGGVATALQQDGTGPATGLDQCSKLYTSLADPDVLPTLVLGQVAKMSIPNIPSVAAVLKQDNIRSATGFGSLGDYIASGFFSAQDKWLTYPRLVARRFFKTKSLQGMKEDIKEVSGQELKKTLTSLDLTCLGVGFMCGAGIFVSPGYIAGALTGPALFVSYLVASLSAFLSSFCYAEFTVSIPMAGAAYNYIYHTLGEVIAWVTVSNLILEYILSNAAAIRGFAPYLAILFNRPSTFFIKSWNGYQLDGWACGVTLFVTGMLCYGIKESATANTSRNVKGVVCSGDVRQEIAKCFCPMGANKLLPALAAVITIVHVAIMFFIIIAGLTKSNRANFSPFIRKGSSWKSIFNGAAVSFFSFIGFDAIATTAEEMKDPARDMPIGILGAMSIVTVIYALMCVTLSLMVPNGDIDQGAAFAAAFDYVGMQWAKYIVCIGALLGIFTTTLIGVLGSTRILVGCCRERMLPPFIAWVGDKRHSPYIATIIIGGCSAGIALFSSFAELANMISIGTFIVFYVVAVGLLWFRCNVPGKTTFKGQCLLLLHTFAIIGFSLGFTLCWVLPKYADEVAGYDYNDSYVDPIPAGQDNQQQYKWLIAMGVLTFASIVSMTFFCKQDFIPAGYKASTSWSSSKSRFNLASTSLLDSAGLGVKCPDALCLAPYPSGLSCVMLHQVPLFPGIPAASIFVNTFLLGQLDQKSYERFGWWTLASTSIYLVYGMVAQEVSGAVPGPRSVSPVSAPFIVSGAMQRVGMTKHALLVS
ncbi:hypothetical protein QJQ45_016315 [Haematococcus lacustris]|nr:hypothetical protein QJQ45_016315 [Haematococcus lacustris]